MDSRLSDIRESLENLVRAIEEVGEEPERVPEGFKLADEYRQAVQGDWYIASNGEALQCSRDSYAGKYPVYILRIIPPEADAELLARAATAKKAWTDDEADGRAFAEVMADFHKQEQKRDRAKAETA